MSYTVQLTRRSARTRFHYDNRAPGEKNWAFEIERDQSARKEIDDIPPFTRQLKHFINSVRGEVEPNCSARDGFKAVLIVDSIFRSLDLGAPVAVEQT